MSPTGHASPPVHWAARTLKLGTTTIPLLIARRAVSESDCGISRVVIVAHGLGVDKEVQRPELERLARAGFIAVCPDAPHHGERRDGLLERLDASTGTERHERFIGMVSEAASELPLLIDHFRHSLGGRVAVAGISMGGFTTFASFLHDPRPDVAILFLASPDWRTPDQRLAGLPPKGPVCNPDRFFPVPLMAVTAGCDTVVPPDETVSFMETLRPLYAAAPGSLLHAGYPSSGHMMRENDWDDAWERAILFLNEHL
ncbi:MAG TPA: alpha/beta fold hydrolase [Candidatus Ozemobacteraceae bacterium]|nr:alpha/beta fold hydrolase [Candidatus Ozemobacteraceae bacterium]